jgi:hypothetical protein
MPYLDGYGFPWGLATRLHDFGMAAIVSAGIARERVLNFLSADEIVEWAKSGRG